ncbi:TauD/TfdA family dioxygenase [Streptomyces sp. NPDC005574]|uniref:TauD/TfdA family dioxygenase n=1 Tax=Streptomyces sp. NPDC005574 TaxID=3156891 RepID=UPI0033B3E545
MDGDVKESVMFPDRGRVALFEAAAPDVSPVKWASANTDLLTEQLAAKGACLLRGFDIPDASVFSELVRVFGQQLEDYIYRSTPRSKVGDVYTSTEYPASEVIPMHNEMAYTTSWPERLWFYSQKSAPVGGQTPLADSRAVHARIPAPIRERFERHGVRYVRNYRSGLGVPWQETFPDMDRAEVDRFCRVRGIVVEWLDEDTLRTTETCQASTTHPVTGETVWMNQAHLFHVSSLNPLTREALLDLMDEQDLPRNAYLGDGTPISDADLSEIRAAFEAETVTFQWHDGDVLIVDNLAMAHGRFSYEGERKLLVAMTGSIGSSRN